MHNSMIALDEKKLWSQIQYACLNENRSEFQIPLYRYTKGFLGLPAKCSRTDAEPRKISAFLKQFCKKYKIQYEMIEKESPKEGYTHVMIVSLKLPHTTVSMIENARANQSRERENAIRKNTLDCYRRIDKLPATTQLKQAILEDTSTLLRKKMPTLGAVNRSISVKYLVRDSHIQVDSDYRSYCYKSYQYEQYGMPTLNGKEMSALGLAFMDYIFENLESEFAGHPVFRNIRILNIGIEVTFQMTV